MKFYSILFIILICVSKIEAQTPAIPTLPEMNIVTENAQNILTWNAQFDGIKSIAIQRSADSVRNYVTIGVLTAPKKGIQTFTDTRPEVGKNHYRLSVNFAGDLEWFSNTYKVNLDSATIAKSLNEKIASGTTNSKSVPNTNTSNNTTTTSADFYYTPSSKIYTNPYTGHININLEDARTKKYSIRFYDPKKNEVLKISRVLKTVLILDKNNFNSKGTYKFELFDGETLVEAGYVTIY